MKLYKHVLYDIIRSRVVIAYTLLLLLISLVLFQTESDVSKSLQSLLTIILLIVPLVSIIFTTIHYYNSYEFFELLLAYPLSRRRLFLSQYGGVAGSLLLAFFLGVGLPVWMLAPGPVGASLLFTGICLTLIFTSLAMLAAVCTRDKARGIGLAILLWFYFSLLYDGILLMLLYVFSDYPMEKWTLVLTALNPIDLGRIFIMLQMDLSALMGYTGAVYQSFFGSMMGMIFTAMVMLAWMVIPLWLALRRFNRKDL